MIGNVRNTLLLKHIGCWSGIPTARFVLPRAGPKTQKSLSLHRFRRLTAPVAWPYYSAGRIQRSAIPPDQPASRFDADSPDFAECLLLGLPTVRIL